MWRVFGLTLATIISVFLNESAFADYVDYRAYAEFTLASSGTIGDATYVTIDPTDTSSGAPFILNDLNVAIFANNQGIPQFSPALYSETFSASELDVTVLGESIINAHLLDQITIPLPGWSLAAGTYWISFFGVDGSTNIFYGMPGSPGSPSAFYSQGLPPGINSIQQGSIGAFRLLDADGNTLFENPWTLQTLDAPLCSPCNDIIQEATPLPDTLPLFATALAALGLFGWRRKRNAY